LSKRGIHNLPEDRGEFVDDFRNVGVASRQFSQLLGGALVIGSFEEMAKDSERSAVFNDHVPVVEAKHLSAFVTQP